MKTTALRLILLLALATGALTSAEPVDPTPSLEKFSGRAAWSTDYAQAVAQAASEKKNVLLNFTGSDWCVWCHRLRDEVFLQKSFLDYAERHLVLLEVDFPRKTTQPAKQKERNETLAARFKVTGYPTIILIDGEGRELGRTGYMQGGAKTFVRELKRLGDGPAVPRPAAAP